MRGFAGGEDTMLTPNFSEVLGASVERQNGIPRLSVKRDDSFARFGLALADRQHLFHQIDVANPPGGKGLTQEGMSIGTPDYMSPEQLSGQELDARSDLYAAGVVLFECLTARLPFEAASVYALIAKHIEQPAPDPRTLNPEIPEGLAKVIMKAMAKEPGDRYQSAAQMHDALAAIG